VVCVCVAGSGGGGVERAFVCVCVRARAFVYARARTRLCMRARVRAHMLALVVDSGPFTNFLIFFLFCFIVHYLPCAPCMCIHKCKCMYLCIHERI
jgi:hypothetical protein